MTYCDSLRQQMNQAGSGISVMDVDSVTNSYNDPAGTGPIYGTAGVPVNFDLCQSIKCGADADDATKYACTQSFGPGVYSKCTDPRCEPYRGGACGSPASLPPTPAEILTPGSPQVLTTSTLTAAVPDITAMPVPTAQVGMGDAWCGVNSWITDNPVMAVAALAGLAFLMMGGKK